MEIVTNIFLKSHQENMQLKYKPHKRIKRQEVLPENITTEAYDNHDYYKKKIVPDPNGLYWTDIHENGTSVLSDEKHLRYLFYDITFDFPFYGHPIKRVAVTTQGFLYMSNFVHPKLDWAYTHYVAPLMGNFDTFGIDSEILTWDDGKIFVVEWRNVDLNDQPEIGNFTFQTVLYNNGTILMAYKSVPTTNYSSKGWPVKAGINDAFYYDIPNPITGGYLRYIVPYHNITIPLESITDNMAIIIHPLPTCNIMHTCTDCTTNVTNFNCMWCPSVKRCSDGNDRLRQAWNESMCHKNSFAKPDQCHVPAMTTTTGSTQTMTPSTTTTKTSSTTTTRTSTTTTTPSTTITTIATTTTTPSTSKTTTPTITTTSSKIGTTSQLCSTSKMTYTSVSNIRSSTSTFKSPKESRLTKKKDDTSAAAIAVPIVVLLIILLVLVGGWIFYARTHPTSRSGLWLIENSPTRIKDKISTKISFFKSSSSDDKATITSKYESQNDSSC